MGLVISVDKERKLGAGLSGCTRLSQPAGRDRAFTHFQTLCVIFIYYVRGHQTTQEVVRVLIIQAADV